MELHFPFYSIGHFIGQPTNPTEFELTSFAEINPADLEEIEDPHKHTFYEIIWVDEGSSTQVIDYQEYPIAAGTLFFILPGQLHHFEAWEHLAGGSLFFTEAFALLNRTDQETLLGLTFLDNVYARPFLRPEEEAYAEIRETIRLLQRERRRPDYAVSIAQALLHVLLGQIQRWVEQQEPAPPARRHVLIGKQLKLLIDQHFREGWTANQYADRLNLTAHHLNRIARQVTGRTTTELIRARTILEAKRLLTFTDYRVADIADALGFTDLSYFARVFRAETGQSPLDFKRAMSEKYRIRLIRS